MLIFDVREELAWWDLVRAMQNSDGCVSGMGGALQVRLGNHLRRPLDIYAYTTFELILIEVHILFNVEFGITISTSLCKS